MLAPVASRIERRSQPLCAKSRIRPFSYTVPGVPTIEPLLIIVPDEQPTLRIANATTGRILRTMEEMGGGLVQNLLPAE